MNNEFIENLNNITEYKQESFEVSLSTGYNLWCTKLNKNEKSYGLYICKEDDNTYCKVGRISDIRLFKQCLGMYK